MRAIALLSILLAGGPGAQDARPLRVFIRAGQKTHGPGEHDHPRFLAEWKDLLKARGAEVDGAMGFPSAEQLAKADVLVMYAPEGGTISPDERARLEAFLKRGGGIAVIHDAVCGTDPQWFKTVVGGAWEHRHSKFHHGEVGLYFADRRHPITRGLSNFFLDDEIYWDLHLMPEARVLANSFRIPHEIKPQLWVYEKDDYRAFVSLQGHRHASFSLPHYRALLLRGIAWAAKREADLLVSKEELASLRYPAGGPIRPDRAHEPVVLHPDFEMRLLAAEPGVVKPISIDWDPRGRLWVAMTPGYPLKAESSGVPPHDSVAFFEDTDGDGRLDRRTVFHEGLDLVTSLAFHKDGVIITQAPDILWLRDTDGDGKSDRREVLFTGFGYGDTHAVMSNLRWGMDGWIYATQGYSGGASRSIRNAAGTDFGPIGNGMFRFRPDGSAMEMVVSYSANTWGMDFSWDGEIFYTMANGSHLRHVIVFDRVLARGRADRAEAWKDITDHKEAHPILKHTLTPYVQIDFVGGFTAASGGVLYDGGAWPAEWTGGHFVTEPTINLVHHDVVKPEGVTFRASRARDEEFVAGRDLWFRPVELRVGPDGALYMADFYNQAVVHNDTRRPPHGPQNAAIRPDRDHEHGRLWRIQHRSAQKVPAARFGAVADLVAALEHPNRWTRMTAHRLLCERREGQAEVSALLGRTKLAAARVHALWILEQLGALAPRDLAGALADAEAGVRKNAAKIAALRKDPRPEVAGALGRLASDPDPRTRLEAIIALGSVNPTPEALAALLRVYPSLDDPWSRSAVLGVAANDPAGFLAAAIEALPAEASRGFVDDIAASVGERGDAEGAARLVVACARSAAHRQTILSRLHAALPPGAAPAVTPELRQALKTLLESGDPGVSSAALAFVGRWVRDDSLAASVGRVSGPLLEAAADPKRPEAERAQALEFLVAVPAVRAKAIAAAGEVLNSSASTELKERVIAALGRTSAPEAGPVLIGAWPRLTTQARDAVFAQVVKNPAWSLHLVGEIEKGNLRPAEIGLTAVFRLRTHPDRGVAQKAAAAIDAVQGVENKAKDQVVASLLPLVSKPGDAAKGKGLFAEQCLKCHSYRGEGKIVAPDLMGIGVHGAEELLTQIVDPNRAVEPNYVSYNVRTRDGDVFNGTVVRDTRESVVLRSNEGDREIRRSEIEIMQSSGLSLMPTGLEALGAEALRDIIAYLAADSGPYRPVNLEAVCTASTVRGLYDSQREPNNLRLRKFGLHTVEGIPFLVLDPSKTARGNNAIVLRGGAQADWQCKREMPLKVEVRVGFAAAKIHVLGGIGAWATLSGEKGGPVVRVTYHYADGKTEEKLLHDGVEFSDWIRRVDVPGSRFVPGIVQPGQRGQVRWFTLVPGRREAIRAITLESFDNRVAPTFLAMTAESAQGAAPPPPKSPMCLIVGGGASHDYEKWWRGADAALLGAVYTSDPAQVLPALEKAEVLYLANNQPLPDPALRKAVFDFVGRGRGLLLGHAATWYNWKDWPEYNRTLVGGGARGHEKLQEFEVAVVDKAHPLMAGVPDTFRVKDELYRFERDEAGPEIHVLARGKSLETGKEYPVAWTVKHEKGRILCLTLGHDGAAHELDAYRRILRNAAGWLAGK